MGAVFLLLLVSCAFLFEGIMLFRSRHAILPLAGGLIALLGSLIILLLSLRWCLFPYTFYRKLFSRTMIEDDPEDLLKTLSLAFPDLDTVFLRFDHTLDTRKTLELSTKQAEFLTLQSQINPHFLYNTLDSIRGDALSSGNRGIADVAEALSTYFRYTISEKRTVVPLRSELQNVHNYFRVQQYRFGKNLILETEIEDPEQELLEAECPKLILQPIVENAILHGFNQKSKEKRISIRAAVLSSQLRIRIIDNGSGMDEATLYRINDSFINSRELLRENASGSRRTGIALQNINQRIRLLYGEEYGLRIYSVPKTGTDVHIRLPYKKAAAQNEKNAIFN